MNKEEVLKKYFGYSSFRDGQQQLIDAVLSGRDALGVMPTGAGKSICYQVPAMMLEGICIVISPLISLMQDQVSALQECGIPCTFVNTAMTPKAKERAEKNILNGRVRLVYVAPERLSSPFFRSLCRKIRVSMIAVDEAHCVSQWGQDFRPSYLEIKAFVETFEKRPVVCAFTATATPRVREDIIRLLGLEEPRLLVTSFDRKNLYFEVVRPRDKLVALERYLGLYTGKSGIVYCSSRKAVDELFEHLSREGYSVVKYHAGMTKDERSRSQQFFTFDEKEIIVATNAFGMGIDKSNVGFVIHYNMPGDLESYYQEAGRAGRDGKNADCILFFNGNDIRIQQYFINYPEENFSLSEEEKKRIAELKKQKLSSMISYCEAQGCLRKQMLSYFGEKIDSCENCSVCTGLKSSVDITLPARKIFSCIKRLKERENKQTVCDVLKGNLTPKITQKGFEQIKTFGAMKDSAESVINEHIDYFTERGYIKVRSSGVLYLSEKCRGVLYDGKHLRREEKKRVVSKEREMLDVQLYMKLKKLRSECAKKASVPDFIILTDATLLSLARKKPSSLEELSLLPGISLAKLKKYGVIFIKAINKHCGENLANE